MKIKILLIFLLCFALFHPTETYAQPCSISNTTLVSTLCDGADNLLVTVSFDVTNGSGSYELIDVDTDTAIGTLTAAETATGLTIEGTVPRPTTAGTAINVKVVDTAVSSGTTELAVNGGFETGDFTGWSQFPSPSGSQTIDGSNPSEGNFAANVFNDEPASGSVLKNANIGIGTVNPGDEITISFDIRGSNANGGVGFAEFFSEIDGGGVSSATLLGGAPLPLNADSNVWTPLSFTVTAGPDVSAGVSFQIAAVTGAAQGSQSNLFIDNLSITIEAQSVQCMGDPISVDLPFTEVTFTGPGDQEVNSGELTGLGGGLPVGGVYSGNGVTDDGNGETYSFDTAFLDGGPVTITYSVTDANGCTYSASDEVGVLQSGPDNDDCAGALPLDCGVTVTGSTEGATASGLDAECNGFASPDAFDLFYTFVADGTSSYTLSLDDASGGFGFDGVMFVYSGPCDDLTSLACSDSGSPEEITLDAPSAGTYTVRIFDYFGTADFTLDLTCEAPPACPAPTGLTATPITDLDGVFLEWTPGGNEFIFDVTATQTGVTEPDGTFGTVNTSETNTTFEAPAPGETLLYWVRGRCSDSPSLVSDWVSVEYTEPLPAPDNDDCADATMIACGESISGSTADATFDDVGFCGTSNTSPGVWYKFVGIDGEATLSTCGTANFDTKLSVFTGECGLLSCVDGNDDGVGCAGFTSELTIPTTAGVEYYVLVHGFDTDTGDFDLSLTCVDPCADDTEAPEITVQAQNETVDCGSDDIEGAFEAWLANNGGAEATDANGVTWSNNACSENTFTVDEFANWVGFIARLDAGGGFIGGEPAPLSAITSEVGPGNQITLQPSLSQPFDPNVTVEGITYIEDPSLVGQEFTFTGNTVSNSLDSGYNAVAFIRIFTASFEFRDVVTMPLMAGESFSLTYDVATIPDAGVVQYGFIVSGPGALGADSGSLGTVVVEGVDTECVPFNNVCGEGTEITFTATDACGQSSSTTATFSLEEPTPCDGEVVEVSITLDNFPAETSWEITSGDQVVASGGTYGDEPDGSTLNIPVCLEDGCYTFTIFDTFGDGICCSFGNGSYNVTLDGTSIASGGEFGSSESTDFQVGGSTAVWTGASDTDWENAANWLDNAAPGLSLNGEITIPMVASNNYPVLAVGQDLYISECSTVIVESSASLTVNPNVVVSNDGTMANDGTVTFESDDSGTAYIGSGMGVFIGDFTVERFIPAKRAYRQLSPAVTTSTPISENWQQDTHITGPAGNTDGFDVTETGNPSAYIFDNVVYDYIQLANTNATNLIPGTMYHILVRGDRNTDLTNNNATPSITTLRATGELTADNNGSQTIAVNVPEQRFIAVGNPFQAQVDMNMVLTTDATNISPNFYWVWDPTLGERGAYTAILAADGTPSVGDTDANQYLQAGQAGWVYTAAAGESSVSFTQSSKYTGMETDVFRNSSNVSSLGKLRLSLYETNALANNETAADGVLIMFDANGNNAVDANDALNITNLDENFAIDNNGELLSIENRAQPQDQDEIQLEINTYRNTNYAIVAEGIAMEDATAFLLDQYTGSLTEIPQTGSVSYNFTVDLNVTASVSGDRFKIVFEANSLSVGSQDLEDLLLYPNPNTGIFFINVPVGMDDLDVTIYSILGVKVYNESGFSAGQNITIDTNRVLSPGSYLVELSSNGKTTTKKLIIN